MAKANKLYIKTAYAKLPALRETDGQGDEAVAHVKLFCPLNDWRWYITEFDPETGEAFGLVQGHEIELGVIAVGLGDDQWAGESMQDQNNNFRGRYPYPPFERDLHWKPKTLGEIREQLAKHGFA